VTVLIDSYVTEEYILNDAYKGLDDIDKALDASQHSLADLCSYCFYLMESKELELVKEQATRSADLGNERCPFAQLRYFIGRLGHHVQAVRVLMDTARRIPGLFEEAKIEIVNGPSSSSIEAPPLRPTLGLDGIANRMISGDAELTRDIRDRLRRLNQSFGIEQLVRKKYEKMKPRVHAELVLLEYVFRLRRTLQPFNNDRYIGVSKPACYCCYLYIREHPGEFVPPATHQNIYVNWHPPIKTADLHGSVSESATRERKLLNGMVKAIRNKTIEKLKARTGGEISGQNHDSETWVSFFTQSSTMKENQNTSIESIGNELIPYAQSASPSPDPSNSDSYSRGSEGTGGNIAASLSILMEEKLNCLDESEESEDGGGVGL
jgi:hypothetical protein